MKNIVLSFLILVFSFSAQAAHQYIQCWPEDRFDSNDRLVVALWQDGSATLYMSSDLDNDVSSGVIRLADVTEGQGEDLVLKGSNSISTFVVTLPRSAFWKKSDDLRIHIDMTYKNRSGGYSEFNSCFSRVYED